MKVAAIQMVSGISLDANLSEALRLLRQAAHDGAELAVLPEYFCFMGHQDADKLLIAETPGLGTVQDFLSDAARDLKMWVVGGTLPMATDDPAHAANASLVYTPRGENVSRYDKIHLFRYDNGRESYDEATVLVAGDTPTVFECKARDGQGWRVGQSVCYDLRFGELYRMLAADLLLVPAAFTHTTGQAHWEVLLRARAIENQAYVIASAQGGLHENGRRTWGHSMVIDPWGEVMALQAEGPGVVLAELDMERLRNVRQQLPALQHRRL
ncbi:carbon-nitrogen hydrolase family protein [Hydrogenophaga taeniospiralis]|jgi:nitrilase|uniref:carbon-nitrogen hydrolase family protein n=1 Tax=Hydrogenophaga taeniospiralis TaxID=65656 RepID=UPI0008D27A00|nr:carbon-nitrogen hydrolase family protein [Hydrogenophaga taeniospiralis]OGB17289.1 MAG: acyltransferase [Burkholderiales bacterium RIFCSPLOWO2_02_FULL_67_64]OGB39546.1 MAG: acyltransferase [Burkholderiales bacterium RIFCSPLOWO2_12_67_14]OGB42936.1 MAG: acyltransferase [Burkholderiales bacterium RIFCSPHIGHO2_12_FULL_67_38]OGB74712.1 MAG: acyltransferase [Burkholderiales bacterium RIFCSPLOWO2_12_FULL_67_210]MCB4362573.1 carbon-nitrogen hydrolase family protein [Hydrogenophaga taeniospiralis]